MNAQPLRSRSLTGPSARNNRRFRGYRLVRISLDLVIVFSSVFLAGVLRLDFRLGSLAWASLLVLALGTVLIYAAMGYITGLLRGRYPYASFDEARELVASLVPATVISFALTVFAGGLVGYPHSTPLIAFPIALVGLFAVRFGWRLKYEGSRRPGSRALPALICGAGSAGELIVRSMLRNPDSRYVPVGLLDDDPDKRRLQLHGVSVLGHISADEIRRVANETGARVVALAIAHADSELLIEIADACDAAGLEFVALPAMQRWQHSIPTISDLRAVPIEDLLGRRAFDTGIVSVSDYISGKRVLITGAGGSIGSELAVQLSRLGPSELMLLDRDESGLQHTQLRISGNGLLNSRDLILADIRDAARIAAIFQERRPDIVFHAAALKHLPLLEQFPEEAWKTNVLGTHNVLQAAIAAGTSTIVNISTDKAANPTSVLGLSKKLAEQLTAWGGQAEGLRFVSVRFGNVLGSRGSLLPTLQYLINEGKPISVTHPDATRYFMTIPEACQLVIQAGGVGAAGDVLILDMGEPVRIVELVERLVAASGKQIEIVYTGLRDGEKLHEDLVSADESVDWSQHAHIGQTRVEPISLEQISASNWLADVEIATEPERTGAQ